MGDLHDIGHYAELDARMLKAARGLRILSLMSWPASYRQPFLDGWQVGGVWGTTWHGAFENDGFRRAFLTGVAERTGSAWRPGATPGFRARREEMLERLADAVVEHLDTDALRRLLRL